MVQLLFSLLLEKMGGKKEEKEEEEENQYWNFCAGNFLESGHGISLIS